MAAIAQFIFLMLVGYALGLWFIYDTLRHLPTHMMEWPWQLWVGIVAFLTTCYIDSFRQD